MFLCLCALCAFMCFCAYAYVLMFAVFCCRFSFSTDLCGYFLVNLVLCDNFIAFCDRLVVAADFPYYRPLSFVYLFGLNQD